MLDEKYDNNKRILSAENRCPDPGRRTAADVYRRWKICFTHVVFMMSRLFKMFKLIVHAYFFPVGGKRVIYFDSEDSCWSRWKCPAWCSGGRRPLIAECLSLWRKMGMLRARRVLVKTETSSVSGFAKVLGAAIFRFRFKVHPKRLCSSLPLDHWPGAGERSGTWSAESFSAPGKELRGGRVGIDVGDALDDGLEGCFSCTTGTRKWRFTRLTRAGSRPPDAPLPHESHMQCPSLQNVPFRWLRNGSKMHPPGNV